MKLICCHLLAGLGSLSLIPFVSAYQNPGTTGPYATGVHDFEYTDTVYPSDFEFDVKAQGRRIMARAWYPVCEKSDVSTANGNSVCQASSNVLGRLRKYLEPGEWEAFFQKGPEPTDLTDTFDLTNSYLDAPPMANGIGEFPVVIYTHGLGMWISDSTALLEEIASQGYTIFAIGSPGYSAGIIFNSTKDVVTSKDYPTVHEGKENDTGLLSFYTPPFSDDVQVRYNMMAEYLKRSDVLSFTRVQDDQLALADYLETPEVEKDTLLRAILANTPGLATLIYMGFSMGGISSGSTAQRDPRAVGAINLDGFHQVSDLLGKASRVPYLTFWGNNGIPPFYINEFHFEPLETMGDDPKITRVGFNGIQHLDFNDVKFFNPMVRAQFGLNNTINAKQVHAILVGFCVGFLDTNLKKKEGWNVTDTFDKLPGAKSVNVSYVKESFAKEATKNPSSSSSMVSIGCLYLSLVTVVVLFLT